MIAKLYLKRGLPPAREDTDSAEEVKQSINLMEGFWSLRNTQYWRPGLPQHKTGVWADLPFTAGRELQANNVQNVKETIDVQIVTSTTTEMALEIESLMQFIRETRRFWTDEAQIEPPYIEYMATGAPGSQYALIYEMDAALNEPGEGSGLVHDVTLTIEREPYWRPIPPGANPKIWTRFLLGELEGKDYQWSNVQADNGYALKTDPATVSEAIGNRYEIDAFPGAHDDIHEKFWITIPKEDIPGDAPALCLLQIELPTTGAVETFPYTVWRSTNPYRPSGFPTEIQLPVLTMLTIDALDAGMSPAYAADTGGKYYWPTPADSRLELTPTGTLDRAGFWNRGYLTETLRGRYALIGRMRQDSGSEGDIQVQIEYGSNNAAQKTDLLNVPLQAGTGNTTRWPLLYMGEIVLPVEDTAVNINADGGGIKYRTHRDLNIKMNLIRNTGSAKFYFIDIVMVKLDEAVFEIVPGTVDNLADNSQFIFYDNTGYFLHGKPGSFASTRSSNDFINEAEIRGSELTLIPGVDNLLYFFGQDENGESDVQQDFTVRLHVLPRWSGVRDV